jgi:hypothetical protein
MKSTWLIFTFILALAPDALAQPPLVWGQGQWGVDTWSADADNDLIPDDSDTYPEIPIGELTDTDGDGAPDDCDQACIDLGMAADTDDDNDGVLDTADAFSLDASESVDTDGDGIGNNADEDDDNDGYSDEYELETGTDPLDPADFKPPYDDLNGIVYHWSKHIALPEVTVNLTNAPEYPPLSETTDESGKYQFLDTPESTVELSLSLEATDIKRTINAGDALAALKIAVGLNPNSDPDGDGPLTPIPVSPYQLIAADLDQDGKVTAGDALAILKVAVGLSSAITPTWAFIEDGTPVWETHDSRNKTYVVPEGISVAYPEQTAVNFAAVLRGDVDSSWAVEGNAVSADYFSERAVQTTAPLSLWGIRDTDGDGLSDAQEGALGTAIDDADTDDDGVSDAQDMYPLDPERSDDAPVGMSIPKVMGESPLTSVQPVTLHPPVLLRGDMNDWGTELVFEKIEDGSYTLQTSIDAGTYTFKIASDNWAVMDLGANSESERFIELGKPVDLSENASTPFIIELNGKAQLVFEINVEKQLIVTESIQSEKTP